MKTFLTLAASLLLATSAMAQEPATDAAAPAEQAAPKAEMKNKAFAEKDKDGDGFISKEEFLANAEEKFGKIDGDNDGKLSPQELKSFHEEQKKNWKERMAERKERLEQRRSGTAGDATETPAAE